MDPENVRDWRDTVPKHVRITGWRIETDWDKRESEWRAMQLVTVFAVSRPGEFEWIRYGFRDLGAFFSIRGEGLSSDWNFPTQYQGWTVTIKGHITKAEWYIVRKKEVIKRQKVREKLRAKK